MGISSGARLGPYEILGPLGAGGMGEVYKARDERLGRLVAIKVMPEHLTADANLKARFTREARAVSQLSHPNICTIHDVGSEGGRDFLVMEYLEGQTLADRLLAGRLPTREIVVIGRQIADALDYAHGAGIVHRDLKPANIMLTRTGAKILDFGLARRVHPSSDGRDSELPTVAEEPALTGTGVILGTVPYMSPEQLQGKRVDGRTDIFSFGSILYEMATGERPFPGSDTARIMVAILQGEPRPLRELAPDAPPALVNVVARALQKVPANRWPSAGAISAELGRIGGSSAESATLPVAAVPTLPVTRSFKPRRAATLAAAIVAVAAAAFYLYRSLHNTSSEVRSIAVLPFDNQGPPDQQYFVDGLTDSVRGKLAGLPQFLVIARDSSTSYRKSKAPLSTIARELGVRYLLKGTVRWLRPGSAAGRVQITPELIDAEAGKAPTTRWQNEFEADVSDVFRIQQDVAAKVAAALDVSLSQQQQRTLAQSPTVNLKAYDAFLRGDAIWDSQGSLLPSALRDAIAEYQQATDLDPGFSTAWARLAEANAYLYFNGSPDAKVAEASRVAAEKALALAPEAEESRAAHAEYLLQVRHDAVEAYNELSNALRANPRNSGLLAARADMEQSLGRFDDALQNYRKARILDPRAVTLNASTAFTLLFLRKSSEARAEAERGLLLAPDDMQLYLIDVMGWLQDGKLDAAREVFRSAIKRGIAANQLTAYAATFWDLFWALPTDLQDLLVKLTPADFDGDRARWSLCLAQALFLRHDAAGVRANAETAVQEFSAQLARDPRDTQANVSKGLALAYLGRRQEALAAAEFGLAQIPSPRDATTAPYYEHVTARIMILVGAGDESISRLDSLLHTPYLLTPGWLKIDPAFAPLRTNPRFQRLTAGKP